MEINFGKTSALGIVGAGQRCPVRERADEWSDSGTPKSPPTCGWERPQVNKKA
ncbi:MAG: hypothetical protein R3Y36_03895 [Spirochaetales bacterium]